MLIDRVEFIEENKAIRGWVLVPTSCIKTTSNLLFPKAILQMDSRVDFVPMVLLGHRLIPMFRTTVSKKPDPKYWAFRIWKLKQFGGITHLDLSVRGNSILCFS